MSHCRATAVHGAATSLAEDISCIRGDTRTLLRLSPGWRAFGASHRKEVRRRRPLRLRSRAGRPQRRPARESSPASRLWGSSGWKSSLSQQSASSAWWMFQTRRTTFRTISRSVSGWEADSRDLIYLFSDKLACTPAPKSACHLYPGAQAAAFSFGFSASGLPPP